MWKPGSQLDKRIHGIISTQAHARIIVQHSHQNLNNLRIIQLLDILLATVLIAVLTQTPRSHLHKRLLSHIVPYQRYQLMHGIILQVGRIRHECNKTRHNVIPDIVASRFQDARHLINVPASVRCVLLHGYEQIRRAIGLEFWLTGGQEINQFVRHFGDVVSVDEGEA